MKYFVQKYISPYTCRSWPRTTISNSPWLHIHLLLSNSPQLTFLTPFTVTLLHHNTNPFRTKSLQTDCMQPQTTVYYIAPADSAPYRLKAGCLGGRVKRIKTSRKCQTFQYARAGCGGCWSWWLADWLGVCVLFETFFGISNFDFFCCNLLAIFTVNYCVAFSSLRLYVWCLFFFVTFSIFISILYLFCILFLTATPNFSTNNFKRYKTSWKSN